MKMLRFGHKQSVISETIVGATDWEESLSSRSTNDPDDSKIEVITLDDGTGDGAKEDYGVSSTRNIPGTKRGAELDNISNTGKRHRTSEAAKAKNQRLDPVRIHYQNEPESSPGITNRRTRSALLLQFLLPSPISTHTSTGAIVPPTPTQSSISSLTLPPTLESSRSPQIIPATPTQISAFDNSLIKTTSLAMSSINEQQILAPATPSSSMSYQVYPMSQTGSWVSEHNLPSYQVTPMSQIGSFIDDCIIPASPTPSFSMDTQVIPATPSSINDDQITRATPSSINDSNMAPQIAGSSQTRRIIRPFTRPPAWTGPADALRPPTTSHAAQMMPPPPPPIQNVLRYSSGVTRIPPSTISASTMKKLVASLKLKSAIKSGAVGPTPPTSNNVLQERDQRLTLPAFNGYLEPQRKHLYDTRSQVAPSIVPFTRSVIRQIVPEMLTPGSYHGQMPPSISTPGSFAVNPGMSLPTRPPTSFITNGQIVPVQPFAPWNGPMALPTLTHTLSTTNNGLPPPNWAVQSQMASPNLSMIRDPIFQDAASSLPEIELDFDDFDMNLLRSLENDGDRNVKEIIDNTTGGDGEPVNAVEGSTKDRDRNMTNADDNPTKDDGSQNGGDDKANEDNKSLEGDCSQTDEEDDNANTSHGDPKVLDDSPNVRPGGGHEGDAIQIVEGDDNLNKDRDDQSEDSTLKDVDDNVDEDDAGSDDDGVNENNGDKRRQNALPKLTWKTCSKPYVVIKFDLSEESAELKTGKRKNQRLVFQARRSEEVILLANYDEFETVNVKYGKKMYRAHAVEMHDTFSFARERAKALNIQHALPRCPDEDSPITAVVLWDTTNGIPDEAFTRYMYSAKPMQDILVDPETGTASALRNGKRKSITIVDMYSTPNPALYRAKLLNKTYQNQEF